MRLRHIALGCALTGALGPLALPPATAHAQDTALAKATVKPPISVSSPVTDNPYGASITITVTLGPTLADRRVSLYATPRGEARRLVAAGKVNAKGKWYPTYPITRTTTFTAVFAGDAHNRRNSASRTLGAYARVTDRIAGYHRTSKGGVTEDIFRGRDTLTLYSTVAPNSRGECLEPETEQYDKGTGWDADTRYGCDKLDGASHDVAPFRLSQAVGDRYRIRGDYRRGAKDTANLSEQGPWLYFEVVKLRWHDDAGEARRPRAPAPGPRSDGPRVREPARRRRGRPHRADVARALLAAVPRGVRRDAVRLPDDATNRAGEGIAAHR
jgi:hypothetical protein